MTYPTYTQQHLQLKSIARVKQIYSQIACTVEVSDKRCKDSWITAIAEYQASKIHKVADEQTTAQTELDGFIATQAEVVAPELLRTVEITFYHHEIYAGDRLIASITHDHTDFVTQRWVVTVNGVEEHRADTWAKCYRYIQWHLSNSQFAVRNSQLELALLAQTYKLSNHRIGIWHILIIANCELRIANCFVWWLAVAQTPLYAEAVDCEELLDRPFEMLTNDEWGQLRQLVTA